MSSQEYTDVLSRLDLVSCDLFTFPAMFEGHVSGGRYIRDVHLSCVVF